MAADGKSWKVGRAEVKVTLPDGMSEGLARAWSDVMAGAGVERRARKAPKPRERLSADRIVDVAIDQMRESGYDAVTMRSIAKALDTGAASLYAHVTNRGDLDALVLDRVAGLWQIPDPDPGSWDRQLVQAMRDLLGLYRDHPGVARAAMGMIPTQPGALLSTERILGLLRAGGVPDQHAAWFVDLMALYVGSVAVEEDIWRLRGLDDEEPRTEEEVVGLVRDFMAGLPPEHFPLLSSMALVMTSGSAEDRFDFAVEVLIGGLKAISLGKR